MHIDLTLGDNRLIATHDGNHWNALTIDVLSGIMEQSAWNDAEFKAVVQTMLLGDDIAASVYLRACAACAHLTDTRPIP